MRLFAATLVLSALGVAPALAQGASDKPFEGSSVTAIGGIEASQVFGDAEIGALYGGQLGYDWQANNIVYGVEGEATGATARHCDTIHFGAATDQYCVKRDRDFYVGGRIGAVVGDSTLLYAKAGYANAHNIYDYRAGGTGSSSYSGSSTADGFRVGVGVEKRLGRSLTLKTEYRYSNYTGVYSRHQAVAGLGFRF